MSLLLLFSHPISISAIPTSISYNDESTDMFYLDVAEGPPIDLSNVNIIEGFNEIDILAVNFECNESLIEINQELNAPPVFNSRYSYEAELHIDPYNGQTDAGFKYITISGFIDQYNNLFSRYYFETENNVTTEKHLGYKVTGNTIHWHLSVTDFPFDAVFSQNTTYYTFRADAILYTVPTDPGKNPAYMDRLEYIPAWILAENDDDDNDLDIISRLPFQFTWALFAILPIYTIKK